MKKNSLKKFVLFVPDSFIQIVRGHKGIIVEMCLSLQIISQGYF